MKGVKMKLKTVTMYRVYLTTNNEESIKTLIDKIRELQGVEKVSYRASINVRYFAYIEIETLREDLKNELEKIIQEIGVDSVKIDVVEVKKPL